MTRIAPWVCLAVLPLEAADPNATALLKGIEQRYNRAQTLQVQFSESYSVLGRARKGESGELTLRKPGRMRWDYTDPAGKLFVSDGKDVYLYTPEGNRVEKTKLKASDDMRVPMAFLLGKLDFAKDFRDFEVKPEGTNYLVVAHPKSDKLPYEKVQMLVTPDHTIQRLVKPVGTGDTADSMVQNIYMRIVNRNRRGHVATLSAGLGPVQSQFLMETINNIWI